MTNQAAIQGKIWRGYAKAAQKLGAPYLFYRPAGHITLEGGGGIGLEDGSGGIELENYLGSPILTRNVSLNAEDMKYGRPNKYGKATWYALFDGNEIKVGDYFAALNPGGNLQLESGDNLEQESGGNIQLEGQPQGSFFFVAAMQALLPILAVECNRTISIFRPEAQSGSGQQPYSGMTADNEKPLVQGVPCSILQGTKGEKSEVGLPGDTRLPWWTILLPASVGRIKIDDLIIDDLAQRYIVSSPELTDLGYRLVCMMAMA